MFLSFFFLSFKLFAVSAVFPNRRARGMSEALERAVERTKEWQSTDRDRRHRPIFTQNAARAKANRPIRVQQMDVQRLNRLMKVVDRAWTLPKLGSDEPIGTNFQYKKTCASIYKARFNACEHAGFGIMCFNFCYEKGEKLAYKCEDASAPSFCRNNANYDTFLSKYKKEPYRAKAYIHQQLTRCYSSAICEGALLNSSLLPKTMHGTDEPRTFGKGQLQRKVAGDATKQIMPKALELGIHQRSVVDDNIASMMQNESRRNQLRRKYGEEMALSEEEESVRKHVPFWQRLLARKKLEKGGEGKSKKEALFGRREEEGEDDEEEEREEEESGIMGTHFGTRGTQNNGKTDLLDWERSLENVKSLLPSSRILQQNLFTTQNNERQQKMVGRQISDHRTTEKPIGFWRSFQPGKWFKSINHMTNTAIKQLNEPKEVRKPTSHG